VLLNLVDAVDLGSFAFGFFTTSSAVGFWCTLGKCFWMNIGAREALSAAILYALGLPDRSLQARCASDVGPAQAAERDLVLDVCLAVVVEQSPHRQGFAFAWNPQGDDVPLSPSLLLQKEHRVPIAVYVRPCFRMEAKPAYISFEIS
jgi:hypothetical protein